MSSAPLRIGLLGLGTVGRATAEALLAATRRPSERTGRPLALAAVAVRSPERLYGLELPSDVEITTDPGALVGRRDLDVIVELMGGLEPAGHLVRQALASGQAVVTANKHLLAAQGPALEALARDEGIALRYEAAVGGGTPILRLCAEDLSAMRIERVRGIVNGTTNWILDRMELDELSAEDALAAAQAAGYAEADPAFDLEGVDAADKIVVLARLAFGAWLAPSEVVRTAETGPGAGRPGIAGVTLADVRAAARAGRRIRLVAEAVAGANGIEASVTPQGPELEDPLAAARGVENVFVLSGEPHGRVVVSGPGAGGAVTAAAVMADLVALANGAGSTSGSLPPAAAVSPSEPALATSARR